MGQPQHTLVASARGLPLESSYSEMCRHALPEASQDSLGLAQLTAAFRNSPNHSQLVRAAWA